MPLTYPTTANTYIPSTESPAPVSWVDLGPDVLGQPLWDYLVERSRRPFPINTYIRITPVPTYPPLPPDEPVSRVVVVESGVTERSEGTNWPQFPTD